MVFSWIPNAFDFTMEISWSLKEGGKGGKVGFTRIFMILNAFLMEFFT